MSRDTNAVWRLRSRGERWVVPVRGEYRTTGDFFASNSFNSLFAVETTNSVIGAGELGAFDIGDWTYTFEMVGALEVTLAAATNTASGTIV
jgi:hypothetical protein